MTESSSKGLTWGTLLAGVVSAFALAAIGCLKPVASRDGAGLPGSNLSGAADASRTLPGFASRESAQRGDNRLPSTQR